jgi:putative PIN family toxin of toxin-antitoxin system
VSTYFIIDTNVVIAGLLTAHADSPVARILDGMLTAAFPFVVSEALLAEYRAVLLRPKLVKCHGLSESEVDVILTDMARHAIVLKPVDSGSNHTAPDPGDQFLWDLLAARADLMLVTGDHVLLQDAIMQQRVMSANEFVAQLMH